MEPRLKRRDRVLMLLNPRRRRAISEGAHRAKPDRRRYSARLGHMIGIHEHPSAWIYIFSLWLVPVISLYTHVSPELSPPLILSTAWIYLELGLSVAALMRGESYSAHLKRSALRMRAALALWVFSDLHSLTALFPWVCLKLLVGYLILMSRDWSQRHRLLVTEDPRELSRGVEALTLTVGLLCGVSMIYFWRTAAHLSLSEVILFIMSQSAYLVLAIARAGARNRLCVKEKLRGVEVTQPDASGYHLGLGSLQTCGGLSAISQADEVFFVSPHALTFLISAALIISSLLLTQRIFSFKHLERALLTPWRAISLSMAALCVLGCALLMTPLVHYGDRGLTLTEAAFTSVSASCITGLSIIDLSQLNGFGQGIILFLIQVGGFGIILITHMIISISADRYSFYVHHLTHAVTGDELSPLESARQLLRFVLGVEIFAACALSAFFLMEGLSFPDALWNGVFTAISAFCNAGFALQSDSFMSYAQHKPILIIISLTVIMGGLGPRAARELLNRWRNRISPPQLSLYTRIILVSNVVLITLPTLFFCFADWGGALAHLDPADKLTNALFHATSLRTAGFNAVDLALLSEPSWSLSLLLMIIGGSPFSTAGGIKVTTVALALVAFLPTLRGERRSLLLDRAQSVTHGAKALSIFLLSFVIIGGALFLLQCLGEPLELNVMLFEVISALGTVGLSQGGTSALSGAGLMVIMLCMFLGRVGPPALLLSFTPSKRQGVNHDPDSYIEEDLPLS